MDGGTNGGSGSGGGGELEIQATKPAFDELFEYDSTAKRVTIKRDFVFVAHCFETMNRYVCIRFYKGTAMYTNQDKGISYYGEKQYNLYMAIYGNDYKAAGDASAAYTSENVANGWYIMM